MVDAGVSMQRPSTKLLLQFRREVGLRDLQFLRFAEKLGHSSKILEPFLATRALAEAPEIGQQLVRNASALIRDSYNHVLVGFADEHLDRRRFGVLGCTLLDDGLDRVPQQLANYVLEVAKDVREGRLEMAVHFDLGDLDIRAVCASDQLLGGLSAILDDFFGIASQENLANGFLVVQQLGVREVPGRVEGLGECQMLLCNDAPGDALCALILFRHRRECHTDLSMVVMNLSVSSGFMRPRTSSTPMARRGITVACSVSVSSSTLQYFSLSSSDLIWDTRRKRSKARRYDS
jgi:hypothetical protein